MNNQILFERIKHLVMRERRIGIEILELLYEIERRKAYSDLKYDGLFTYCVKELKFTDAQAFHRIQAMRALKEIPEIKPMIESGALSVSSVSKVQVHLRQETRQGVLHTKQEKLELFQSIENHTSKQVDQALAFLKGKKITTQLVIELDEESEELWRNVKELSAHKTSSDNQETFKMVIKEWIKRNDPLSKTVKLVKEARSIM